MSETATIRVPVETRNKLAELAALRGTSVAKLISEFASSEHLHQIYADERRSWSEALERPEVIAELELWDAANDEFD